MNLDFSHSLASVHQGITEGLHSGAQLYVSVQDQTLLDTAIGQSRPGVPMTPDSLNLWLSSTKPIAAVAIAQLWERGLLDLDDPVIRFIPEFSQKGKGAMTLRHILTHTAGFRVPPRSEIAPWDQIIAEMCAARLEVGWIPGQKAGYHPASSWYILGEIVRRLDGRDYSPYVREMIFNPLGMRNCWIGMPPETFHAYGDQIARMDDTTQSPPKPLDAEPIATSCRPGSSGYGPIRELGRFYEMLMNRGRTSAPSPPGTLGGEGWGEGGSSLIEPTSTFDTPPHPNPLPRSTGGEGTRLLTPQSVESLTARHRTGLFDHTFKAPMDWALGFLLNSPAAQPELPYGYGPRASTRTFGHGGAQSSGAYCDPERGLVVAYAFNGRPGEAKHHERRKALIGAIEEDLARANA